MWLIPSQVSLHQMACLVWNNVNFLLNNYVLDQEMDGAAITQTFGTCVGPDCLRDVVSKFGVRIKVYTAIRTHLDKDVKANVRNTNHAFATRYFNFLILCRMKSLHQCPLKR